jgi:hypothetical protein
VGTAGPAVFVGTSDKTQFQSKSCPHILQTGLKAFSNSEKWIASGATLVGFAENIESARES